MFDAGVHEGGDAAVLGGGDALAVFVVGDDEEVWDGGGPGGEGAGEGVGSLVGGDGDADGAVHGWSRRLASGSLRIGRRR